MPPLSSAVALSPVSEAPGGFWKTFEEKDYLNNLLVLYATQRNFFDNLLLN